MINHEGIEPVSLPPPDVRLISTNDMIDTPVDDLGLVDIDQLITDIGETIDPDYQWSPGLSVHHFQWPEAWYKYPEGPYEDIPIRSFRNLPPHKGLVPREFENWLHKITLPPAMPSPEVVVRRHESWGVAKSLFLTIKDAVKQEKMARRRRQYVAQNPDVLPPEFNGEDIIGEEIMQEILEKHFRGIIYHLEKLSEIPPEHKLVDETADIHDISRTLGQLVVPQARILKRAA